jgi:hypothetical protein
VPPFAYTSMNRLLLLTALIEALTGLALIVVPTLVVRLLLGGESSGAAIPLGRVAGVALLALGVACWLARAKIAPPRAELPVRWCFIISAWFSSLGLPVSSRGPLGLLCGRQSFFTRQWASGASGSSWESKPERRKNDGAG